MTTLLSKARQGCRRIVDGVKMILRPEEYFVYPRGTYDFHQISYSQEGEDRVLASYFRRKRESGFFVDVGAYHPQRFSNTYLFYLRGWRGINIDAQPNSMQLFRKVRPRDINLEMPIHDSGAALPYFQYEEPAVNGFSRQLSEHRAANGKFKQTSQIHLQTHRLEHVLDRYLPAGQPIDFLTIDVEGMEFQVLNSNDWKKYRPEVVLLEVLHFDFGSLATSPACSLLMDNGYHLHSKLGRTLFFARRPEPSAAVA